jgi:hypothetical protein
MIILGLAGPAGSGKGTVSAYLAKRYGFIEFAFSDGVYREVAAAFGVDESFLRARATKETPTQLLAAENCNEEPFVNVLARHVDHGDSAVSPRQILQLWGTNYRRSQDPDYWVKNAEAWIERLQAVYPYPEIAPQHFVEGGTRFENEREWIHNCFGNVWHLRRDGVVTVNAHVSETPLPVLDGERELWNNSTIERLHAGVDLLMSTTARFVKVEPMQQPDAVRNETHDTAP